MTARNPRPAILSALVLVAATALATGCGGGSDAGSASGAKAATVTAPAQGTTPASAPGSPSPSAKTKAPTGRAVTIGRPAVANANAICARRNHELAAIPGSIENLRALTAAARKRARIEQRALGELEGLAPPSAIRARYRQLIALDQAALLQVVKLGERAQAGDAVGVRAATVRARAEKFRLLAVTVRTGLRECSGMPGFE